MSIESMSEENMKILMIGGRYSNFINSAIKNDCAVILDENRCGNSFEKDIFIKSFEEENNKENEN